MQCEKEGCPALLEFKQHIDRRFDLIENLVRAQKPPRQSSREDFLCSHLEQHKNACYAQVNKTSEGIGLFPNSETFHRTARTLVSPLHLKVEDIEGDTYYCLPDFDIETVRNHAKARRYRPDDPKLIDPLGKLVYECDQLNVRKFLEREYPSKGTPWIDEIMDNLERSSFRIRRDSDNPDIFCNINEMRAPPEPSPPPDPRLAEMKKLLSQAQRHVRLNGDTAIREPGFLGHDGDNSWLSDFRDFVVEQVKKSPNLSKYIAIEPGEWVIKKVQQ